jgi:hypothetical protein
MTAHRILSRRGLLRATGSLAGAAALGRLGILNRHDLRAEGGRDEHHKPDSQRDHPRAEGPPLDGRSGHAVLPCIYRRSTG